MIAVVLFDLDGVVRHFDQRHVENIESQHGIAPGEIERVAFSSPLIDQVTTGRMTRHDWITRIGDLLGNEEAAIQWGRQPFRADPAVLAVADAVRAIGLRTAILTNGTDTVSAEATALGLGAHFEAIFNSARIGYAKPHPRAFQHVLDSMRVAAGNVFFIDDSPRKLAGARALGMTTHRYTRVARLEQALRDSGIAVRA